MGIGTKTGKAAAFLCAAALIASLCLLPGCGLKERQGVIVAGSTSVQPYAEVLEEAYALLYPENIVDVQGGGSSAGITAAENGTADIGMSSRHLKDAEQGLWTIEIAKDGLAIIVHPRNPVHNLTLEQIRGIYSAQITNWKQLGGDDAKIHIITREAGSGTRSAFTDFVMGKDARITQKAIVQDSNGAVRLLVSSDKYAIGFISLGLVDSTVKAIELDGVAATRENVMNGSYTLLRPFLFVCKEAPTGKVKDFIDFVMSEEGQRILNKEGLIPAAEGTVG